MSHKKIGHLGGQISTKMAKKRSVITRWQLNKRVSLDFFMGFCLLFVFGFFGFLYGSGQVVVKPLSVKGYAPAGRIRLIGGAHTQQRLLRLFDVCFVGFAQDARRFTYLLGARVLARDPVPRLTVDHFHALSGFNVSSETRNQVGGGQWLEEDERNLIETIRAFEIFLQDQVNVVNR